MTNDVLKTQVKQDILLRSVMHWVVAWRSMMRFDGPPQCQEPRSGVDGVLLSGVDGVLLGYDHPVRCDTMEGNDDDQFKVATWPPIPIVEPGTSCISR